LLKTSVSLLHLVGSFDTNRLLLVRKPEELFTVLERLLRIFEELCNNIKGSKLRNLENFMERKDELITNR
jgi:hypothetical protein